MNNNTGHFDRNGLITILAAELFQSAGSAMQKWVQQDTSISTPNQKKISPNVSYLKKKLLALALCASH